MAGVATRGVQTILDNKRFEDYQSLKQHFQHSHITECNYNGWQITAGAAAEVLSGERAITHLGTAAQVYIRSLADLEALDGDSIYVEYQDNTGAIQGPIEHLLDIAGGVGTETLHALGNENVLDTVAACNVDLVTLDMTTHETTVVNDWAGKYLVVYVGDQIGTSHLIKSNTIAAPTIVTLDAACANVNIAADSVQIQTYPCADFFRLRRMWSETEAPEDNAIELTNSAGNAWYGEISDWNSRSASCHHFTQPEAVCRSFLGKVHLNAVTQNEGDTVLTGFIFSCTFTPKAIDANETPSDVTLTFWFDDDFVWEPCIELAGGTDVTYNIGDQITIPYNILVDTSVLEVYDVNKVMT